MFDLGVFKGDLTRVHEPLIFRNEIIFSLKIKLPRRQIKIVKLKKNKAFLQIIQRILVVEGNIDTSYLQIISVRAQNELFKYLRSDEETQFNSASNQNVYFLRQKQKDGYLSLIISSDVKVLTTS